MMSAAESVRTSDRPTLRVLAASAAVVLLDQVAKAIVRGGLPLGDERTIIPGVMQLTHVQNRGAAFGLFPSSTLFLTLISIGVCVAIVWGRTWWADRGVLMRIAVALELGGALGNLIDRVAFGQVTDFILFTPNLPLIGRWPAFNFADSALTMGALMMAVALMLHSEPRTLARREAAGSESGVQNGLPSLRPNEESRPAP